MRLTFKEIFVASKRFWHGTVIYYVENVWYDRGKTDIMWRWFLMITSSTWQWSIATDGVAAPGKYHYNDVIMSAMASQITSLTIVYSSVYSGADQRKHQSSASLAFVRGIHRWPVNSPHKRPVTRKIFASEDVIMYVSLIAICSRDNTVIFLLNAHNANHSPQVMTCFFVSSKSNFQWESQLCRHWRHHMLSIWQPTVPPVAWQCRAAYNIVLYRAVLWGDPSVLHCTVDHY